MVIYFIYIEVCIYPHYPQDWKKSVFIPILKKDNPKLPHNCTHLICWQSNAQNSPSQASTVCAPWTSRVQAGFRKGRGTRDQIANICWIIEIAREFKQSSTSAYWLCQSLWLCGSSQTDGKFWKRWKYQTTSPASLKICMQVKKQQWEPDMKQWSGSKFRKGYIKAVYCHPAYL